MKFPQIAAYALFMVCTVSSFSQTKSLSTFPTAGLYFENTKPNIKMALDTDVNSVLFNAIKKAEMEEIFEMKGPFTVFAPTNEAFSKISKKEWQRLLQAENRKELKGVLTYHVVAGNLTASKILRALCRGEGQTSFTTIQGEKISVTMQGTDIILSDCIGNQAKIIAADSEQSNGVIHQIDNVVLPADL